MDNWLRLFPEINKLTFAAFHKELKDSGISSTQAPYLMCVAHFEGCSQDKLVKVLRIDKGCVAKTIKQMEERGYIERKPDPKDKRGNMLYLTDQSRQLVTKLKETEKKLKDTLTKGMTTEEVDQMIDLLKRAAANLYYAIDWDYPPMFCHSKFEKGEI